jgi:putative membrane protein
VADNPNRARDHLANERTFLAWVRTGAAIVVFGFAIGRFAIAMRQLTAFQGHPVRTAGLSVWMGAASIVAGVVLVVAGLFRYRKTRVQLDAGTFEPAGFVLDVVTILTVLFRTGAGGIFDLHGEQSGVKNLPCERSVGTGPR